MLIDSIKTRVVGVDIAYAVTTYAIVDVRGNILARETFPTQDYPNINDFVAHLSESILLLAEQTCGYEKVRSVGIGSHSGNFLTGCIEYSANMPWKGEVPLAAMLRDRTGLAVALANNSHVRALGEYTYGGAHGMQNFIVVTLGHGVGSCMFSNGRVYLGSGGFAGEIGHTCMTPDGRECTCGRKGCLEAYCSTRGIVQTAQELLGETAKPSLMRSLDHLSPRTIAACCDQGDRLAIETYRRTGQVLGMSLANYASVINPEAIFIAGGISLAGRWLFEPVDKTFEEHVFHNVQGRTKILASSLSREDCDVLGASALAWKVKEYSLFK